MITIKTPKEIILLREGGRRLAEILEKIKGYAAPGVSTSELNRHAERLIAAAGGTPSFKGYCLAGNDKETLPYPAALCTSINDEIVHGIPSDRKLKKGDILGLDIGMIYQGLFTDMAETIAIGAVGEDTQRLLAVTRKALFEGIAVIKEGVMAGVIGAAIQAFVEANGFVLVSSELGGHGVGYAVHEEPLISNWREIKRSPLLRAGMVLAIEPMVAEASPVTLGADGWTYYTADGSLSAHFEHTIVVTKDGSEILTQKR